MNFIHNKFVAILRELIVPQLYFIFKDNNKRRFVFNNHSLRYLCHPYNRTWVNERIVEVPIALHYLKTHKGKRILEVGNVLKHYTNSEHDVLDKYEIEPGVINEDVVDFKPKQKYDLILCVSTLEHVGWDEKPKKINKSIEAVKLLKKLLANKGMLVITIPIGYNPVIDNYVFKNKFHFTKEYFLNRISRRNYWKEISKDQIQNKKYSSIIMHANTLFIGTYYK
ncbi:hypothetical protein A3A93_06415 [Candidatus Roizmanbacteria bacterium RIFCSPLOWO2_01_FULL_38_12]|uniref:Methyltransferase type 11 domain-containing protein n=2 Tax=Candidatus Roizmaniibacteriota TaxID=1752723 RepID=A0A1F7HIF9_9BACT|nr:MAG: hypothetical protein A3F29_03345 [Candidatus Roizmanbacteria bacterium RIFCSPHIGHO2_12_FULL_33_9]OGK46862.1 MAG: hypothetical protein A3A93_06415 [Candidatus Roizmanbacteria bacterium RIFCSPLOWO2_01_FULL_38_12]